jgi:hypothetical protein
MGMCKNCGRVVGPTEFVDGFCTACASKLMVENNSVTESGIREKGEDRTESGYAIRQAKKNENSVSTDKLRKYDPMRFFFGIVGVTLLIIGVFAPFVVMLDTLPVSLFGSGQGDGVLILIGAFVATVLIATKHYEWVWIVGVGSLAVLIADIWFLHQNKTEAKREFMKLTRDSELLDAYSRFSDMVFNVSWGAAIVLIGALALVLTSLMRIDTRGGENA